MDRIRRLHNAIRDYAWGSRTALARLQGRPAPSPGPEAELWMGAHPAAPSQLEIEGGFVALGDWIRRDPELVLGSRVVRRLGTELPFLLKVLAAERPLSIQAHPDAARARAGFERENAAGIALDEARRSYRDPRPKPELICALSPFTALCGFREVGEIIALLSALGAPGLSGALKELRQQPGRQGLERFFAWLLSCAPPERERVVRDVVAAAGRGAAEPRLAALVLELAEQHPGDAGVVAPLLLNHLELKPGEALYLPAGEPHAYLGGVAVEIMANSDNVLRGGLTAKHVDVPELLAVLSFREGPTPVLTPRPEGSVESVYETPAAEFRLSVLRTRADLAWESPRERSVEILLGTEGAARVVDLERGGDEPLTPATALLVPAAVPRYRVEGEAVVFRASVPKA